MSAARLNAGVRQQGRQMRIQSISLVTLLLTSPLFAIVPHPTPKFCAAYFEADTVFVGELLKVDYFPPGEDNLETNYLKYRFRVVRALRGNPGTTQIVLSENASARWVGDVGKTYVVFAENGMIWGSGGPLDDPSYVERVSKELEEIRRAKLATVEGDVVGAQSKRGAAAGMRVRLYGLNENFTAITDPNGRFSFRVPPGQYLVVLDGARPSDYSKGGDQPFKVVAGQCAQFEFEVKK